MKPAIIFTFILFLIAAAGLSFQAAAVSITGNPAYIDYSYGKAVEFSQSYGIGGAPIIEAYIEGDLVQYAKLIDPQPNGPSRTISVKLSIPATVTLEPGQHSLFVGAIEAAPQGVMVGGRAAIRTPIYVTVPRIGVWLEPVLTVSSSEDGSTRFNLAMKNSGSADATGVAIAIQVLDKQNNTLTELNLGTIDLASRESKTLQADWDWLASGAKLGEEYLARAVITQLVEGETTEQTAEKIFRLAALEVRIVSFTNEFAANEINPIQIIVESLWNSAIPDVYAEMTIDGKTAKTVGKALAAWEKKTLTGYWDAKGTSEGTHKATITIYYAGKTVALDSSVLVSSSVKLLEQPGKIGGGLSGLVVALLITLGVVIVIFVAVLALKPRGRGSERRVE